jgi:nitrate/nitrite-specific signal transduction histidine kinase
MSDDRENLVSRAHEFLQLFKRGADFTKELLRENERLRRRLAQVEEQQQQAARSPEDWSKLRMELLARIQGLESEYASVRERLVEVEAENRQFADRYLEIEEENNNLANLYVASQQLHSSLDLEEVLNIIIEIVINLVGAEVFAVLMLDEGGDVLRAVAAEGVDVSEVPDAPLEGSPLGAAVVGMETVCFDDTDGSALSRPLVCIPLGIEGRPVGAIAIHRLLEQKDGFSDMDHELFNVLSRHAATAIYAARLFSQSERKPGAIQGCIDLPTK